MAAAGEIAVIPDAVTTAAMGAVRTAAVMMAAEMAATVDADALTIAETAAELGIPRVEVATGVSMRTGGAEEAAAATAGGAAEAGADGTAAAAAAASRQGGIITTEMMITDVVNTPARLHQVQRRLSETQAANARR
mmetsp:Transcript_163230/g.301383  ORF Transcript_163230/g.301383 Transcript_163230/m.301383 type:complete len:136 (+) Transcript_163230:143-550(+)